MFHRRQNHPCSLLDAVCSHWTTLAPSEQRSSTQQRHGDTATPMMRKTQCRCDAYAVGHATLSTTGGCERHDVGKVYSHTVGPLTGTSRYCQEEAAYFGDRVSLRL
jgi:hypothetical protein